MKQLIVIFCLLFVGACANQNEPFMWPKKGIAIPDERTAVMVSLAIFQGQLKRDLGDPTQLAKRLTAFRYRTSDLETNPKGDAWFVKPTDEEAAEFDRLCANQCVGGNLYTMALSAHDGRVLEFYIPQ